MEEEWGRCRRIGERDGWWYVRGEEVWILVGDVEGEMGG